MPDLLAIVAHPDDAELNVAGTLLKHADAGGTFAIVDLTRGERGTRGSAEIRAQEAAAASRVLRLDPSLRWNLEIPDGAITSSDEHVARVVTAIRHFRPKTILLPYQQDRHPDHEDAHHLVRRAVFESGLVARVTEHNGQTQVPYRPQDCYAFFHTYETPPSVLVDITSQFERKLDAVAAYASQFTIPGRSPDYEGGEPHTFISTSDYIDALIARMRHWGFMAGVTYAEAFVTLNGPPLVDTLVRHGE